jgi:GTP-binding protein
MFIDRVKIRVEAGAGGDGITSFRREKHVPLGGPDGGNGGAGGNILFQVDPGMRTLLDLNYQKIIKGKKGESGGSKNQYGKNAEDIIIKVPPGTVITDLETNLVIADLTEPGNVVIVAHGGRGGRGNKAFATHANPAPNISEKGEPGEVKELLVELKLIADVGLVGMPNVGKSTILSVISEAKPKIGDYPFTTLVPNLGVVKTKDNRSFVVADLPGLIEGASKGEGLGDEFLKHIERTRIIVHVIDMGAVEGRDPYTDYITINRELYDFNQELLKRPQIIIANKMDIVGAEENLEKFKEKVKNIPIFEVAARNHQGLDKVLYKLADMLDEIERGPLYKEDRIESHILYKFKKEKPFTIKRYNNVWIVKGKEIEKLLMMTKFTSHEAAVRFACKLRKFGVDDKLEELGAKDGDIVRILDFEFEYRK